MKKITQKKSLFLLIALVVFKLQAQQPTPGSYKFKNYYSGNYMTVDAANTNIIGTLSISPNSNTQIFTIVANGATGTQGGAVGLPLYNIVCNSGGFGIIQANSTNVSPLTSTAPNTTTNPAQFAAKFDATSGGWDFPANTSTGRYISDNQANPADANGVSVGDGNIIYVTSPINKSKWILEPATVLGVNDFDSSSVIISNPVNNKLYITSLKSTVKEISIYNLLGSRMLFNKVNNETSVTIDVSTFSSGVYLVKIAGDNLNFTKKIVKQ